MSSFGWAVADSWTEAFVGSAKTVSAGGAACRGTAKVTVDCSVSLAEAEGTEATAAAAAQRATTAAPAFTRECRATASPLRPMQSLMIVWIFIPTRQRV
jgi:hypothetical protein